jgi:hypothetical protein
MGDERSSSLRQNLFSQVTSTSSFNTVQRVVDPVNYEYDNCSNFRTNPLIGTVEGNVDRWVLINVSKPQSCFYNQLLRLET